jgi:hypothetical protein
MASSKMKWGIIAFLTVLVLVAVGIIKGKVVEALGPESEIKDLKVGWFSVEVQGLRIKGRQGWPAADTLRVERVVITPSLRSLLSDTIRISSVTVVRPYLSALRARDGKLQVVPSLLEGPAPKAKGPPALLPGRSPFRVSRWRTAWQSCSTPRWPNRRSRSVSKGSRARCAMSLSRA